MDIETRLRQDATACLAAAVKAVDPEQLVIRDLANRLIQLPEDAGIWVVGIGKAASAMAKGALKSLKEKISGGVLIVPEGAASSAPDDFEVFEAGHPVPDEGGVRGAEAIVEGVRRAGDLDVILCLISGGGSALMTLPPDGVSLADVQDVTDRLLKAGATINEINCVRKHLDRLKGGRLAREALPTRILALILSDVVGDPVDVIASGPVSPDPTTFSDSKAILGSYGVWRDLSPVVQAHIEQGVNGDLPESPKEGDPCFEVASAPVIGNNLMAATAAREEARRLGYEPLLLTTTVTGEAQEFGRLLGGMAREIRRTNNPLPPPACLVTAGETTVTVKGDGAGGRNQEVALGAAMTLKGLRNVVVASAGTDGTDGPTDAAGAIATGNTVRRAEEHGLDPAAALAENNTYPFFKSLGDLIMTGPTGTNVMDIQLVMVGEES